MCKHHCLLSLIIDSLCNERGQSIGEEHPSSWNKTYSLNWILSQASAEKVGPLKYKSWQKKEEIKQVLAFKRMNTTYTIYTTHRINKKITYQYESSGELLNEKTLYKLLCSLKRGKEEQLVILEILLKSLHLMTQCLKPGFKGKKKSLMLDI